MAVAYFMSHAGTVLGPVRAAPGPGPHSFFPHLNGGEITVLYCFLWLYLVARGPGPLQRRSRAWAGVSIWSFSHLLIWSLLFSRMTR